MEAWMLWMTMSSMSAHDTRRKGQEEGKTRKKEKAFAYNRGTPSVEWHVPVLTRMPISDSLAGDLAPIKQMFCSSTVRLDTN